ncbi:hypothetical protein [Pontibacter anaerobius]|uniref:GYD domain-containing protein n=1 Tax=Pontibacter anaerobius TaxID=2993940 RepID=A0ABT3RCX6_9BACT|nr:hypothetical protein [Pontibacter anaerobius]MCX2739299.1 hypothetical protein [Pontibacter anaerobius]
MTNYVLLYHFDDAQVTQQFEGNLRKVFKRNKEVQDSGFKYFGFADVEEPGVVDKLDSILNDSGIGVRGNFGQNDYVALYFSREKDPDNIKRQLLIGTDEMVDKGAERMSTDAHRDSIQNLLGFNYQKG